MTHRLTFGQGTQTVRSVPHRADGRPVVVASCTFEVVDLRHKAQSSSHVLDSGAATVDNVSTTLSAAAGRGTSDPRSLTVASAAGVVVGRRYLVRSGGKSELVRVDGIDGTTLRLIGELPTYFASASQFVGIEVSASVPEAVCEDENYLGETLLAIRWLPSGQPVYLEPLYLERQAPATLATADEMLSFDRGLAAFASNDALAAAIVEAQIDLNVDFLKSGVSDTAFLTGPIGRRAVLNLAAWHALKHSTDPAAVDRREKYFARYVELKENLVVGADKEKTRRLDEDNAATPKDVRGWFAVSW